MARKFKNADPTAYTAIGNVDREGKRHAPRQKNRRRIVQEFPEIFADLSPAESMTITLAAARIARTGDAWAISAEHLETAKIEYFQDDQ